MSNLLNEFNIHSYHIKSRLKASTAERVNRTIKQALWKIFHETKKTRCVDVISEVVDNYNKTYHTTIKMTPDEVTWENSTWNEHQLGSIHIIRILANHNRRNSSKFNEILRSKPILLCVILPRLGIVISGLILALSRICLMQR